MISRVLIIGLLLCFLPLSAQTTSVQLEWEGVVSESIIDEVHQILSFQDAIYVDEGNMLPQYHVTFPLTAEASSDNYTISLGNQKWETLSVGQDFVGADQLTADVQVAHAVVSSRRAYQLEVWVTPLRKRGENAFEKLVSFDINVAKKPSVRTKSLALESGFVPQSVLSSGKWVKISLTETGIYKLTYKQIQDLGLDPKTIRLFGYGGQMLEKVYTKRKYDDLVENAMYYSDGGDGKLDAGDFVLFYGHGPLEWKYNDTNNEFEHTTHLYSDIAYYFLTSGNGEGLRMQTAEEITEIETLEVNSYTDYAVHEDQILNILESGSLWFGQTIKENESAHQSFTFNPINEGENAVLSFSLASRTIKTNGLFKFYLNDEFLGSKTAYTSTSTNTGDHAKMVSASYRVPTSSNNLDLRIEFPSTETGVEAYIDWFRVNVRRPLVFQNSFVSFRDPLSVGSGFIAKFNIQSANTKVKVMDVTEPTAARLMKLDYANNSASFKARSEELREYLAFNPEGSFPSPKIEGTVENQNLHGLGQADMVIISPDEFLTASEELATLHESEGLKVHIVNLQQIYNEFSSGQQDITAIRWFLKMFYDRASGDNDMIRYLLLMGDGTFDNMGVHGENSQKFNFIPTYQSENSLSKSSTYVSDDYYGMLDDYEGGMGTNDRVDIGVGRLPVSSVQQAADVVSKIKYYAENRKRNTWKNSVCFVGDDEDGNLHMRDANRMADKVMREHPEMVVNKILLDAYKQVAEATGQRYPEAEALVEQNMEQGVLLWNYSGHGGETGLTAEQIMTKKKIKNYENLSNLPVWVTATCEFSRFDLYKETTAGEHVVLSPKGGGVSMFTTTRLVYASSNFIINNNFFDYVFAKQEDGTPNRLGDVCRLTKAATGTGANKRKFLLLGDPALKMNYPTMNVKTSHINGKSVSLGEADTISALETFTVKGYIENESGDTAHSFNGFVYPQVYDKIKSLSTLNNDNEANTSPLTFDAWQDLIFNGKSEVIDGMFEFSFKVPKEINYEFGKGRIVYYASSNQAEANGYYNDVVIGGFGEDVVEDLDGPLVNMYMNQPGFANGGTVNTSPLLIAEVFDENGISTAGSGIGHDIVAILDDDPSTLQVLNAYYEAVDGNSEGLVKFKFEDLSEGEHTLFFRVWDVYNNSTVQSITFNVDNNESPDVNSLYCYPNPARDMVSFVFEHDRPESVLELTIEIFNLKGQKIAVLDSYTYSASNTVDPIEWDLKAANGLRVQPGMYLYRAVIEVDDKQSAGATKKLIVL